MTNAIEALHRHARLGSVGPRPDFENCEATAPQRRASGAFIALRNGPSEKRCTVVAGVGICSDSAEGQGKSF